MSDMDELYAVSLLRDFKQASHKPKVIIAALVDGCDQNKGDLLDLLPPLVSNAGELANEYSLNSLLDDHIRTLLTHDHRGSFQKSAADIVPLDNAVKAVRMMVEDYWELRSDRGGEKSQLMLAPGS